MMTKTILAVTITAAALVAAPAAFANGTGGSQMGSETSPGMPPAGSGAGEAGSRGTAGAPASGANAMSRGTSGNSGPGAPSLGGSNAMSGNGKR